MRRTELGLFVILSAVAMGAAGCGVISFDVSQDIPATTIFGDPNASLLVTADEAPLTLDIQAETDQRHTGPASAAYLKDLSFTITTPKDGTFYFADSVSIYLQPKNPNSSLAVIKIAELTPIPATNSIHVKPLPNINMLPYSNEGAFIKAQAAGHLPTEDTTYVGHVVVTVKI